MVSLVVVVVPVVVDCGDDGDVSVSCCRCVGDLKLEWWVVVRKNNGDEN